MKLTDDLIVEQEDRWDGGSGIGSGFVVTFDSDERHSNAIVQSINIVCGLATGLYTEY